jgi:hypothetical protein
MAEYGGTILALQDTTGVTYHTHLKTEGIGYISDKTLGVNVHSCLAVTCDGPVLDKFSRQYETLDGDHLLDASVRDGPLYNDNLGNVFLLPFLHA